MLNRTQRTKIAAETIEILNRGTYVVAGQSRSLSDPLKQMREGTTLYTPGQLDELINALEPLKLQTTFISVINCTTFAAAKMLIDDGYANPLCLNFASAKNPGGGFLSGSQAQEESLARASGLYDSLTRATAYYEANRACSTSLYTNHLIYSPSVPVFRNDADELIVNPYLVSIVTSPAVNAGAIRKNEPSNVAQIHPTMAHRIRSVLAVARQHQHDALVLGAWGCGVFQNDPHQIAAWFAEALLHDDRFTGAFDRVIFAVLDFATPPATFNAFERVFSNTSD